MEKFDSVLDEVSLQMQSASDYYFSKVPLYKYLAQRITEDRYLLTVAASATKTNTIGYLFFGIVKYLIYEKKDNVLIEIYRKGLGSNMSKNLIFDTFKEFCKKNENEIINLLKTKHVQTNEVGRSSILLLGLNYISILNNFKSFVLVELGASAGLNLLFKHFYYSYNRDIEGNMKTIWNFGSVKSNLKIECHIKGNVPIFFNDKICIKNSFGIELNKIDLNSIDDVNWLNAFIWPGSKNRTERLMKAVRVAKEYKPSIFVGDATINLNEIINNNTNFGDKVCLFHSFLINQLSKEQSRKLIDEIRSLSFKRLVYQLEMERSGKLIFFSLSIWEKGKISFKKDLGLCDPHGDWIQWFE